MHRQSLSEVGFQGIGLVKIRNIGYHLLRCVNNFENFKVSRTDVLFSQNSIAYPVDHALPVFPGDQHNGEINEFVCLDQRNGFGEFVERSEPAGQGR